MNGKFEQPKQEAEMNLEIGITPTLRHVAQKIAKSMKNQETKEIKTGLGEELYVVTKNKEIQGAVIIEGFEEEGETFYIAMKQPE